MPKDLSSPLLHLQNIHTFYGAIPALHGINLVIHEGEIVTLIGANGAGKSTLMMTIFGDPPPRHGRIFFRGQDITGAPPSAIAHLGLAQVPEGRRIFPHMSVYENLYLGALVTHHRFFSHDLERVFELFPLLKKRLTQKGGTLSGGEQQMLAIARALMSRPQILLLDEPSLGLAPLLVKKVFETIKKLNQDGLTLFLVEQNAYHALRLAHRAYVLVNGQITQEGPAQNLLHQPEIQAAYLEGGTSASKG